jgi:hypothetical protein
MSSDQDQPRAATNIIVDAYEKAIAQGIPPETVATAALSTAIGLMVQIHGEDLVAKTLEDIPQKVRSGSFTHE